MLFLIILLNHISKGRDTVMSWLTLSDFLSISSQPFSQICIQSIFEVFFHFMAKVSDFAKLTRIFTILTLFSMFNSFLIFQRLIHYLCHHSFQHCTCRVSGHLNLKDISWFLTNLWNVEYLGLEHYIGHKFLWLPICQCTNHKMVSNTGYIP